MSDDVRTVIIGTIVALLIIGAALVFGDSSSDAPADPSCAQYGNC